MNESSGCECYSLSQSLPDLTLEVMTELTVGGMACLFVFYYHTLTGFAALLSSSHPSTIKLVQSFLVSDIVIIIVSGLILR